MSNVGLCEASGDPSSMRIMCYGIIGCLMFKFIYQTITTGTSDLSLNEIITIALALGGKNLQKVFEGKKNGNGNIVIDTEPPVLTEPKTPIL